MSGNLIKLKINNRYEVDIMNYLTHMDGEVKVGRVKSQKTDPLFVNPLFVLYFFQLLNNVKLQSYLQ